MLLFVEILALNHAESLHYNSPGIIAPFIAKTLRCLSVQKWRVDINIKIFDLTDFTEMPERGGLTLKYGGSKTWMGK